MRGPLVKRVGHKLFTRLYRRYFEIDFAGAVLTIQNEDWLKNNFVQRGSKDQELE